MKIQETYFTMRDGIKLYTRIVLPEENQNYPVVFIRTPYEEKPDGPWPVEQYADNPFIQNGYAVIVQHVRGRGGSEGDCVPYTEREDGLKSLEIIRTLPFYNGEIYLTGGSYLSTVHYSYLEKCPPDVKAAALAIQTEKMYFRNYRNGCCYKFCNLPWFMGMIKNRYPDQKPWQNAVYRPYRGIMERILGEDLPEFTNLFMHNENGPFWESMENAHALENLSIPVLFTEGWYDYYIGCMFAQWDRIPEATREKCAFVIGPWGHGTKVNDDAEYAFENGNLPADYIARFFNSVRDNTPYTDFATGKITYHSIGGDFWTNPGPSGGSITLYPCTDGALSAAPGESGEISYTYDPDAPTGCFRYGNIFKAHEPGSVNNVFTFTSAPAAEETHFFGKVRMHLKVRSSCEDSQFFARLYFVEDGTAYNLTEAITAISHINKDYVPFSELILDIESTPIGFTLKKGSCLRLDITSHSDIYVPNANVKGHWAEIPEAKVSQNTLLLGEDSYVELPVMER